MSECRGWYQARILSHEIDQAETENEGRVMLDLENPIAWRDQHFTYAEESESESSRKKIEEWIRANLTDAVANRLLHPIAWGRHYRWDEEFREFIAGEDLFLGAFDRDIEWQVHN